MKKDKEWLKKEIMEFDTNRGYADGVLISIRKDTLFNLIDQLDEPELPVIPQFVANHIEGSKQMGKRLNVALSESPEAIMSEKMNIAIFETNNIYARAWLDGYTIEKEPQWTVKLDDGRYVDNFVEFAVGIQIDITSKLDCTAPIRFKDKSKAEAVALLVNGEVVEVADNV